MSICFEYRILYRDVVYESQFGISLYDENPTIKAEGRRRWEALVNEYGAQGWKIVIDGLTGTYFQRSL